MASTGSKRGPVLVERLAIEVSGSTEERPPKPKKAAAKIRYASRKQIVLSRRFKEPFRFVDLPAEIRNRIYRLAIRVKGQLRIRCFKPPAIARVSRQLRAEALPVFFDVNTFLLEVKASHTCNGFMWGDPFFIAPEDVRFKQAGTLSLRQDIIDLFKGSGTKAVLVKNLYLEVKDFYRHRYWSPKKFAYACVMLKTPTVPRNATLDRYIKVGFLNEEKPPCLDDVKYITNAAVEYLEGLIDKPGYNGLSVKDIQKLANTLRIEPRRGANVLEIRESKTARNGFQRMQEHQAELMLRVGGDDGEEWNGFEDDADEVSF